MLISVRLYRKNKLIKRVTAKRTQWRKVYAKLASAHAEKYLVRVEYGKHIDVFGKRELFYNEYFDENLKEAKAAFKSFIE